MENEKGDIVDLYVTLFLFRMPWQISLHDFLFLYRKNASENIMDLKWMWNHILQIPV
jgi:hypothetical protein